MFRKCLIPALCCFALPAGSPARSRLLSRDNLSQVPAHAWTIKGFPHIGIVVRNRSSR